MLLVSTRKSSGPASIAPFLAGLGRPPALPGSSFGRARAAHGAVRARLVSGKLLGALDCLVTGGAGFIGSNLVDALIARGDRVTVIDNLSTGKRENLEQALARRRDRCTRPTSATRPRSPRSSTDARPEVVFHLAAQIDVRHSVEQPGRRCRVQRARHDRGARGGARGAGSRRVVFSSTGGGLYGDADVFPTPEDSPIRPLAPVRAEQATRPRATASCTPGCTGSRRSRFATATSTGRARTSTARPAWSRSSAGAWSRASRPTVFGDGTPDARLGRGRRRRARQPAGRRLRRDRPGQHRPRPRDVGARSARGAARGRRRPASCPSPSSPRRAPARCGAAAST